MDDQSVKRLLAQLLAGEISAADKAVLANYINQLDEPALQALFKDAWSSFEPGASMERDHADRLLLSIIEQTKQRQPSSGKTVSRYRRIWARAAVAAAVLLILTAAGLYFLFFSPDKKVLPVAVSSSTGRDRPAPAASKALVTLADGRKLYLDSVGNGILARQGDTRLEKLANGQLVYTGTATGTAHNTLTNPRGSRVIDITLGDGSRVWLNAGSSITYPVAFPGKERKVSITGEAYFEVAQDPEQPFVVSKGNTSVQVLGTHVNVNAYDDEPVLKVTLLEGSVKVVNGPAGDLLLPGQQAQVTGAGAIRVAGNIDTDEVMAWKNGEFQFTENMDISAIMRQISRWYDVEIVYQDAVKGRFWGSVPRNANVSQVLALLEKTGGIRFSIEGNRVTVMP